MLIYVKSAVGQQGPGITKGNNLKTGITYYKMYGLITGFRVVPLCDSSPAAVLLLSDHYI